MDHDLRGQRFVACIFPGRRTAMSQRNETRSVFARLNYNGRVGGGDFSLKFRGVRVGWAYRSARDEERHRQRNTSCCNQDGRTIW